ncbi:polysaccharide deacetylase family protein [bacterium]|nr:polysaccharide deacetylase family protein [bacterium]
MMDQTHTRCIGDIPIITFHKVDPSFEWGVTRVTPRQFERVIAHLAEAGFTTVSLRQLQNNASLPERPIIITFDDGYESVYTHALPILRHYGFTATVFVISGYVGAANRWDVNLGGLLFSHLTRTQIAALSRAGFEIGSHTVHHPDLTRLPHASARQELLRSRRTLSELTDTDVTALAFPFGRYNRTVVDLCRETGYRQCCGFWRQPWTAELKEPVVFQRKAYYLFDTLTSLQAKYGNGLLSRLEQCKLRLINVCSHGTALVKPYRE